MIDQHEHKTLAGPASEEAQHRLEQFGEQTRFAGSVITDPHRLKRLMRRSEVRCGGGAMTRQGQVRGRRATQRFRWE